MKSHCFFFSSRRRHTRSVSAFLLNRSSDLPVTTNLLIFIEARINLSRFVVTGCAAKTSATVTFPSLNLISLRSEERRVGKEFKSRRLALHIKKTIDAYVYDAITFMNVGF